jgi:hypothetical protein
MRLQICEKSRYQGKRARMAQTVQNIGKLGAGDRVLKNGSRQVTSRTRVAVDKQNTPFEHPSANLET